MRQRADAEAFAHGVWPAQARALAIAGQRSQMRTCSVPGLAGPGEMSSATSTGCVHGHGKVPADGQV
jgi:hypothetical protein